MALPFGISWFCTLLLWGCVCFPPPKGYNIAHALSPSDDEFSSHAGMLGQQTSNQFHSGASLNANQDSVGPEGVLQAMRPQSLAPTANNKAADPGASFSDDMMPSKPHHDVPPAQPFQEYEHESSEHQHPFGFLLKEHTEEQGVEGVSFPTIKAFKRFIERMKSSFLTPGTDLDTHFQIAHEMTENEIASHAENIEGEPDSSYRSAYAKEGPAPDDISENKVWSGPMNSVFEQSAQDANYQMPSESLSVPDPVDSTASLISTSVYDNQDSAYPHHILAPTEHVSSNSKSFDSGGLSGKSPDTYTNGPHVRNEIQSTSYRLSEKIPSGSFFGKDWSFNGHVPASPVNVPPSSQSQDFIDYSSKTWNKPPLSSEKIQQTIYTSGLITGDQEQFWDFEPGKDFKSEERGRLTPANILSAPKPRSLNLSHLPASTGSISSGSNNPLTQSSGGHVGVQTSSPHDAQSQVYNTKQPDNFHSIAKPPSSLQGSVRHDPNTLTAYEEKPDLSKLNLVSATRGHEHMADDSHILLSSGLDSSQSGVSSQFGDGDENFNSLSNMAPTSASERLFSRLAGNEVMSRNLRIKNIISDLRSARKPLGSFYTPLRQGFSLSDYMRATTAGRLQTIMRANKIWKSPAFVKELGNMAYWPLKPLSAFKVSASTLSGVFWTNGGYIKRLDMSQPFAKVYTVQSRKGYVRGNEP